MSWQIVVTSMAKTMLMDISDRRIREKLIERIDGLKTNPELQGKALIGELAGLRSVRAVGQRYRIIYKVERQKITVLIVFVGIRKQDSKRDIYALAKKMLKLGLLQ